jgi:hypothetical protein
MTSCQQLHHFKATLIFFVTMLFRGITRPWDKLKAVFWYAGPIPPDAGTPSLLPLQLFAFFFFSAIGVFAT